MSGSIVDDHQRQCVCRSCCYLIDQHAWDMVSADASVGGVWFAMNAIKYGLVPGPWGIAQAYGEAWIAGGLASAIDYGMAYAEYAFGDPDLKWQCDNAWDWGDAYCDCLQR